MNAKFMRNEIGTVRALARSGFVPLVASHPMSAEKVVIDMPWNASQIRYLIGENRVLANWRRPLMRKTNVIAQKALTPFDTPGRRARP